MSTSHRSTLVSRRRPWLAWGVEDVEEVVDELTSKGVPFERYDKGPIITDERGIATFEGGAKVAYFKGSDGNILSVARAPRS